MCVIQAHDEKSVIDNLEAGFVVPVPRQCGSERGPHLAVLGGEHADRVPRDLVHGQLVGIGDDGLQVPQDLALCQHGPILVVKHVKPVCRRIDSVGSATKGTGVA